MIASFTKWDNSLSGTLGAGPMGVPLSDVLLYYYYYCYCYYYYFIYLLLFYFYFYFFFFFLGGGLIHYLLGKGGYVFGSVG